MKTIWEHILDELINYLIEGYFIESACYELGLDSQDLSAADYQYIWERVSYCYQCSTWVSTECMAEETLTGELVCESCYEIEND